jgi:tetratricopeptide (TPR) repeat protein
MDGMLSNAIKLHRQGRLADAERVYRQILALDPRHAETLHLLGTLAHQVGQNEVAVELIRAAIAVDKQQTAYHCNLGAVLQAQGNFDEAGACYERALALKPDLPEAHLNLGTVLETKGQFDQAAARFRQAIALKPDLAEAHVNLGNLLAAEGKLDEAIACQERALAFKPSLAEAFFNLGNALQAKGEIEEAVASYRQALALKPQVPEFFANLGNALLALEKPDDAVACYERALSLKPNYGDACYNLGNARQAQGKLEEAAACYERALVLKPRLAEAHYNLGNTRQMQDRLEDAEACFERALSINPHYAEAHYNLGCVLQAQGKLEKAFPRYATAIELKPDYPQARFGQALAQLLSGDFAHGWPNYERRWQSIDHDTPFRLYPQPLWHGERLSHGRLLLWGEQGIGDEIQFAGLIPDALRAGNPITLDCDPRLQPLFARSFPGIQVVAKEAVVVKEATVADEAMCAPEGQNENSSGRQPWVSGPRSDGALAPEGGSSAIAQESPPFSAHLPTGSLPALFRRDEAAFSATTSHYIKADPDLRQQFRARYGEAKLLVGLAWKTINIRTGRKRSIELARLAPVFQIPGIRWISLQYGNFDLLEEEAASALAPVVVDRDVDQFADLDRFAAQVAAMDRVLTIDNSTAHLAGALGMPTWLMLPFAPDWRWFEGKPGTPAEHSSPWYPTLRLFRQPALGDWNSVVTRVQGELASELQRS